MGLGRQTFKHTIIYSMGTVFGRLASFLMLPFYAHIFQAKGYGVIATIDTSLGLLTILLSGGFQTGILRIYHEQDEKNKHLTLGTGILLVWILGISIIFFPFIFSASLSKLILGSTEYYPLICLALVSFVIDVAGQSASTIQIIRQQSLLFSIVNLSRLILGLLLNIWLIIFLKVGLVGVFISSLTTAIISSLIFHIVAFQAHGLGFSQQVAIQLLRFQLPLLPGEVISFLGRQTERVLVRILVGLEGMGILEMAYKFPPLLNLFITIPFQRAWRTKSLEIAGQTSAPQIIGDMFTRYFFMMVFLGLLLAVSIQSILKLTTPSDFWPAIAIAKIEIMTTIINGSISYLSFGILYQKKTMLLSLIIGILTPVKIFFSFIFISVWGLKGAAYSALIMECVLLIWIFIKAQALYKLPLEYWKIFIIIIFGFILFYLLGTDNYLHEVVVLYVIEHLIFPLVSVLNDTLFQDWNLGKTAKILKEREGDAILLFLNAFFALSFLALMPFILKSRSTNAIHK